MPEILLTIFLRISPIILLCLAYVLFQNYFQEDTLVHITVLQIQVSEQQKVMELNS